MKDRQIKEIISIYGTDPARWPATPKVEARDTSDDFAEARMVDRALDSLAHPAPASQALRATILSIPAQAPQKNGKLPKWKNFSWWPFGNILGGPVPQLGGLIFACVLGVAVGYSDFLINPWNRADLTQITLGLDTPQGLISLEGAIGK